MVYNPKNKEYVRKYSQTENGKAIKLAYQRSEKCKEWHRINYTKTWLKRSLKSAKHRAKVKGLEFDLREEDIIVPEYCPILKIKLQTDKALRGFSPSIDRIDNSKGYTKDNVAVISMKANRHKSDLTLAEAERLLKYMKKENLN